MTLYHCGLVININDQTRYAIAFAMHKPVAIGVWIDDAQRLSKMQTALNGLNPKINID